MIPNSAYTNDEAEKKIDKIKEIKDFIDRENYYTKQIKIHKILEKLKTIRTFGKDIYNGKITLEEADMDQSDLLDEIRNFSEKTRPKSDNKNKKKKLLAIICINFVVREKWFLMGLKSKYF